MESLIKILFKELYQRHLWHMEECGGSEVAESWEILQGKVVEQLKADGCEDQKLIDYVYSVKGWR